MNTFACLLLRTMPTPHSGQAVFTALFGPIQLRCEAMWTGSDLREREESIPASEDRATVDRLTSLRFVEDRID